MSPSPNTSTPSTPTPAPRSRQDSDLEVARLAFKTPLQQSRRFRNGYEVATPKEPSHKPYTLASTGKTRQKPIEFVIADRIVPIESLSEERLNELAQEHGLLKEGQRLRDYQVRGTNLVIRREVDVCVVAPTGAGKSSLWTLPLLARGTGISLAIVPFTSLGVQGENSVNPGLLLPLLRIGLLTSLGDGDRKIVIIAEDIVAKEVKQTQQWNRRVRTDASVSFTAGFWFAIVVFAGGAAAGSGSAASPALPASAGTIAVGEPCKQPLSPDLNRIWDTLDFEAEVQSLRKRFTDKSNPDYVFKPAYHKRIPADGVAFYMQNIWEQVQSNKDLDLPTQQELLAQFRCDEISAGALAEFNEQAKSQKRPVESGRVVEGLGAMMRDWRTRALARYDRDASRYHKGVYTRKRADLTSVIDSTLSPLFLGQLKNMHKLCVVTFKQDLLSGLKGDDYDFAEVVTKATKKCEDAFTETAKEALVEGTDWNWEDELEVIREEIRGVADQCRKDETKKMINQIERNVKKIISEPVEIQLSKPSPQMWDAVLKTFKETLEKAEATYLAKAKSFNCTEEENVAALASLRKRSWIVLRQKIEEQTADQVLLGKLRGHFEEQFRYDEEGVPRVWKPDDDIDGAFKKAKEQTLELVPLYSRIKPSDPSLEFVLEDDSSDDLANEEFEFSSSSSLVVLSETKCLDLINKFRRDADAYYVEAKRSTVSSIAQIPYWMYGVLVVLGWNEAMAVLFNPLYFTFLLFGLATAYMIIQLGLTGPLLQVTKSVAGEVRLFCIVL
ncbi:hypothetical protein NMY22_g18101 [Coprinellus aureogranulatus]|nr:hypothetical protein NMY22_g18101 [Coprinellus aureogranulatus]